MQKADLVLTGAGEIYTARPAGDAGPDDPSLAGSTVRPELLSGAAVACAEGRIVYVGPESELETAVDLSEATVADLDGRLLTPGLIDPHTHLVFDAPRHEEYALRCMGADYQVIAAAGGGIRSSVRTFRAADEETLYYQAVPRLLAMAMTGTTAVEIKSGYGLSLEDELKALRVIARLDDELPVGIVPTFLGAHEIPDEYREDREGYVRLVIEEMLPAVEDQGIASFCDVFCETGVFTAEESERILTAAKTHSLGAKIHSDEFDAIGGTEMAVRIGAVSAEHLTAVTEGGIAALAGSDTVAVLLPGTTLFLGKTDYAPARALLDSGAAVALATDFNPGSSTFLSLPLMMTIACSQMKMHPAEAWQGVTTRAAQALGLEHEIGRIEVGMRADLVVWDADDYRLIPYAAGHPLALVVIVEGEILSFDGEDEPVAE